MYYLTEHDSLASLEAALGRSGSSMARFALFLVGSGPFHAQLISARIGSVRVICGQVSVAIIARVDKLPAPCVTFRTNDWAEPAPLRVSPGKDTLVFRPPGMEQFFSASGGGSWGMVVLDPDTLTEQVEKLTGRKFVVPDPLSRLIQPSTTAFADMRRDYALLVGQLTHSSSLAARVRLAELQPLADRLALAAARCLDDPPPENAATRQRHAEILQRMRAIVDARPEEALQISDLCDLLDMSSRTLHAVCLEHFGMGPKRYLTARRLDMARRALAAAPPEGANVTAIALRCGFWELGRFAVAYKKAFGESPSDTLRRDP